MDVNVRKIKKFYGKDQILDIDNFTFKSGRISGIMGSNGAGKTTLLNIMAGLDDKYEGYVRYGEKSIEQVRRKVTLVFQKGGLFKRSVYENIAYPLRIRGLDGSDIKSRVDRTIKSLEIENLRDKKAHKLSGGETQKVALARALVFKPSLLLLDEPTASIDPEFVRVMEKAIVDYNRETGATVIIITHSKEQAERMCDELVFLQNGRVGESNGFF
ncbi:tungstate transport system ATP-binding protein [Peptoclostridium litorale DSM 5388]|uniref:Methionine import ATP-binding protein MetN n=1 Tax=Peptoclostridium litorale DSM 5388 TaxID=1121324 RepID=A0A069RCT1_PEPLI|nr:ATP-binding cassette domain-containing protein [Peptoclostridium litorale]KDR94869.1 methionine import ATP-binding protein MetN [Peptoclostridium litorale DSM 5388]SIN94505.1 tungstate transport system ATP-binding protein [Peptoclostridium litorale DSM 5388]